MDGLAYSVNFAGMKKLTPGSAFTVFLLFFGIALLDAISNGQWVITLLWLLAGFCFLLADIMKRKT